MPNHALMGRMFVVFVRAASLLLGGALAGLLINAVHPRGARFNALSQPIACSQTAAPASGGTAASSSVDVLSLEQVAQLCADPRALVVDARTAEEFAQGHVSGAIHLPCRSSRDAADAAVRLLASKDILVVYGNGTDDARPVAEEIRNRSERADVKVAVLAGGFGAWSNGGLACSSGPCPECGDAKPHPAQP